MLLEIQPLQHWGSVMSDLSQFIQSLLESFSPGLDVTEGSPAYTSIVSPLLEKFGEGILSTNVEDFLTNKLKEQFPGMSADSGDAITDILIHATSLYFESYRRELTNIRNSQSLANLNTLSDADADLLAANWLVTRDYGSRASGFIRIEFQRPTTFSPGVDAVASTATGLQFSPAQATTISAAQMLNNILPNGNYYADVLVRAKDVGVEYNVAERTIRTIIGVPGAVAVYNLYAFTNGRNADSTQSLIRDIIPKAITERSLVTAPGVNARVRDNIPGIQRTQVIGFKDPEMNRDLIETKTDGDVYGYGAVITFGQQAFIYLFNQREILSVGDVVRIQYLTSMYVPEQLPDGPELFEISEILRSTPANIAGETSIKHMVILSGTPYPDNINIFHAIPGAVVGYIEVMKKPSVVVNVDEKIYTYPSGGIHVGGHTDVYGQPHSDHVASSQITAHLNSISGFGFIVSSEIGLNMVRLPLTSVNRSAIIPGNYFCVLSGDFQGNYCIHFVEKIDEDEVYLILDTELGEANLADAIPWSIANSIEINIFSPAKILLPFGGIDPTVDTTVGSRVINTPINFTSYGVEPGDTLRILNSDIAGDYKIESLTEDMLIVEQVISQSQANLSCTVLRKDTGLLKPLTNIDSIKLDSTSVPYGRCLGAEIISLGGSREIVSNYAGYVAPSFLWALSIGELGGVPLFGDTRPNCDYSSLNGNERAYSSNPDTMYECNVFALENLLNGGGSEFTQEFCLPKELLQMYAPNNMYVCLGNTSYADISDWVGKYLSRRTADGSFEDAASALPDNWRHLIEYCPIDTNLTDPAPVEGGILTINEGLNKGSYVINKVWRTYLNFGPANSTHRRLPISILRIDGEFPNNPLGSMASMFDRVHRYDNGLIDFGDAIRLFLAPEQFIENSTYQDRVTFMSQQVTMKMNIQMSTIFSPAKAKEFLRDAIYSNYSLGLPAQGTLRAYFENPVYFSFKTFTKSRITHKPEVLQVDAKYLTITENELNRKLVPITSALTKILRDSEKDKRHWSRDLHIANHSNGLLELASDEIILGDSLYKLNLELDGRDLLEILPEISVIPSPLQVAGTPLEGLGLLKTKRGSPVVTLIRSSNMNNDFRLREEDIGSLLFIDSGPDIGSYTIVAVDPSNRTITLDTPLSFTTPNIQAYGTCSLSANNTVLFTVAHGNDDAVRSSRNFLESDIGKYITLYNLRSDVTVGHTRTVKRFNIGTYLITGFTKNEVDANHFTIELELDGTIDAGLTFPQDISTEALSWTITDKPTANINSLDSGLKECLGGVDFRLYDSVPETYLVSDVHYSAADTLSVRVSVLEGPGIAPTGVFNFRNDKNPHRWVRYGEYRITAKEMANNTFGSLYYADIPIMSLGFGDAFNNLSEKFCTLDNYYCEGYYLKTQESNLTYSVREETTLVLPIKICPPDLDYFSDKVNLVGESLSIVYRHAPDISLLQAVIDSYGARVMCASMLARRMLPAKIGAVLEYSGGISETSMKTYVQNFIDTSSSIYNTVSVSSLISVLYGKGATYVKSPIDLIYVVEDLSRNRIMFKSKDAIKYTDAVYYDGTPRITGWKNSEDLLILARSRPLKTLGV